MMLAIQTNSAEPTPQAGSSGSGNDCCVPEPSRSGRYDCGSSAIALAEDPQSYLPERLGSGTQQSFPDPDDPAWGVGSALFVWIASIILIVVMPLLFLL